MSFRRLDNIHERKAAERSEKVTTAELELSKAKNRYEVVQSLLDILYEDYLKVKQEHLNAVADGNVTSEIKQKLEQAESKYENQKAEIQVIELDFNNAHDIYYDAVENAKETSTTISLEMNEIGLQITDLTLKRVEIEKKIDSTKVIIGKCKEICELTKVDKNENNLNMNLYISALTTVKQAEIILEYNKNQLGETQTSIESLQKDHKELDVKYGSALNAENQN